MAEKRGLLGGLGFEDDTLMILVIVAIAFFFFSSDYTKI